MPEDEDESETPTKESVNYRKGEGIDRCFFCKTYGMFGLGGTPWCTKLNTTVRPGFLCDLYDQMERIRVKIFGRFFKVEEEKSD